MCVDPARHDPDATYAPCAMDEAEPPTRPSAEDLGVSRHEYEQILRGLRERDRPAAAAGTLAPARTRSWGPGRLATTGLLLAVVLGLRWLPGSPEEAEPAYAFLSTNGDAPVTYTSCRPIQVAVYPSGGPPDAEALVREAVGRMRSATGLDLVVVGAFGGHAPNWDFEAGPTHPEDPISVSWQDGDAIAELTDHVAGLGGSRTVTNPDGTRRYVAGTIALSSDYYDGLARAGDHDEALAVLMHEFGHVLGLDHVDAPGELMHHDNLDRQTLGPGDLEGLRRLGRGPCV